MLQMLEPAFWLLSFLPPLPVVLHILPDILSQKLLVPALWNFLHLLKKNLVIVQVVGGGGGGGAVCVDPPEPADTAIAGLKVLSRG